VSDAPATSICGAIDIRHLARARAELAGRAIAVTGGASFIGSHLVEALLEVGAEVRVIDDLSTGDLANLEGIESRIDFRHADLADRSATADALADQDIVYHLAAVHGGRGFLASHSVECLGNLVLDHLTMEAASRAGVTNFIYASSASVYPVDVSVEHWPNGLPEDAAGVPGPAGPPGPGQNPDGPYGWSKLMGEYQLSVFAEHRPMNGVVCRIFNTYGERSGPGHAVRALVAKALASLDPFPVWGDGSQTRGFTYVGDVVTGLLLCGGLREYSVVNLGSPEVTAVVDLLRETFRLIGWTPQEISYEIDKPQGTSGRVADPRRCRELLGWQPATSLAKGLERTIAWCRDQGSTAG
jgi:UDP-glucose 4-epimerase